MWEFLSHSCVHGRTGEARCSVHPCKVPTCGDIPALFQWGRDTNHSTPCRLREMGLGGEKGRLQSKWFLIIFWFTTSLRRQEKHLRLKIQWSNAIDFHIYFMSGEIWWSWENLFKYNNRISETQKTLCCRHGIYKSIFFKSSGPLKISWILIFFKISRGDNVISSVPH